MAVFRPIALRAFRHVVSTVPPGSRSRVGPALLARPPASRGGEQPSAASRGLATAAVNPYKTLGLNRDASEDEIKKAYRKEALKWHPDKNPEDQRENAQKRFSDAAAAYEILKDPDTRREYDQTGRVGGGPGGPGGHGAPGGFQNINQADAERLFREAFGQGGMESIMQQLFQQQQQAQQGQGRPGVLQVGMEVRIVANVDAIHRSSRASNIDTENDDRRARCAGKVGTITKADPRDQSVKLRVPVQPGRADEVWFGAGSVEPLSGDASAHPGAHPFAGGMHPGAHPFAGGMGGFQRAGNPFAGGADAGGCGGAGRFSDQPPPGPPPPRGLGPGTEVVILSDVAAIHEASRNSGIGADNDGRRARCVGKMGTVVDADPKDQTVKVRVMVLDGKADELWFGAEAMERLTQPASSETGPREHFAGGM